MPVTQFGVVRASAENNLGADAHVNVLHFQLTSGTAVSDANALTDIATIMDNAYAPLVPQLSNQFTFGQIRGQIANSAILLGTTGWPTLTTGTNVGAPLPYQLAVETYFPTNISRKVGKIFVSGVPGAGSAGNGVISAPVLGAFATFGAFLVAPQTIGANTWQYVVYNRLLAIASLPTTHVVPNIFRTQRRRRQGVGA